MIKKAIKKAEQQITTDFDSDTLLNLPLRDRSLFYAMYWCSSNKSNLDRYPVKDVIDIANTIYEFLSVK